MRYHVPAVFGIYFYIPNVLQWVIANSELRLLQSSAVRCCCTVPYFVQYLNTEHCRREVSRDSCLTKQTITHTSCYNRMFTVTAFVQRPHPTALPASTKYRYVVCMRQTNRCGMRHDARAMGDVHHFDGQKLNERKFSKTMRLRRRPDSLPTTTFLSLFSSHVF